MIRFNVEGWFETIDFRETAIFNLENCYLSKDRWRAMSLEIDLAEL